MQVFCKDGDAYINQPYVFYTEKEIEYIKNNRFIDMTKKEYDDCARLYNDFFILRRYLSYYNSISDITKDMCEIVKNYLDEYTAKYTLFSEFLRKYKIDISDRFIMELDKLLSQRKTRGIKRSFTEIQDTY